MRRPDDDGHQRIRQIDSSAPDRNTETTISGRSAYGTRPQGVELTVVAIPIRQQHSQGDEQETDSR